MSGEAMDRANGGASGQGGEQSRLAALPYEILRRDDGEAALSFNLDALVELGSPGVSFQGLRTWDGDDAAGVRLVSAGGASVWLLDVPDDVVVQARRNGFLRIYGFSADGGRVPLRLTESVGRDAEERRRTERPGGWSA